MSAAVVIVADGNAQPVEEFGIMGAKPRGMVEVVERNKAAQNDC